jgi:hypothetical protein
VPKPVQGDKYGKRVLHPVLTLRGCTLVPYRQLVFSCRSDGDTHSNLEGPQRFRGTSNLEGNLPFMYMGVLVDPLVDFVHSALENVAFYVHHIMKEKFNFMDFWEIFQCPI